MGLQFLISASGQTIDIDTATTAFHQSAHFNIIHHTTFCASLHVKTSSTFKMWIGRRMERISLMEHRTNEEILQVVDEKDHL